MQLFHTPIAKNLLIFKDDNENFGSPAAVFMDLKAKLKDMGFEFDQSQALVHSGSNNMLLMDAEHRWMLISTEQDLVDLHTRLNATGYVQIELLRTERYRPVFGPNYRPAEGEDCIKFEEINIYKQKAA